MPCQQPDDSSECGIFVLEYSRRIMSNTAINFPSNKNYFRATRKRIMVELALHKILRIQNERVLELNLMDIVNKLHTK